MCQKKNSCMKVSKGGIPALVHRCELCKLQVALEKEASVENGIAILVRATPPASVDKHEVGKLAVGTTYNTTVCKSL